MAKITDKDVLDATELANVPRAFVVIQRRRFTLTLWRRPESDAHRFRPVFKCPIAIGAVGFETPPGAFFVLAKARKPDWQMPHSSWVPEHLRGTVVPGGSPDNPIREAFLKLTDDGVGIHGTNNLLSLRSKASHGCIRVRPKHAIRLYEMVAVGTPVCIA